MRVRPTTSPAPLALAIADLATGPRVAALSPTPLLGDRFRPTQRQDDTLLRVRRALTLRNCALLADRVGSGKSIMGLQILAEELANPGFALVTTPASLHGQWKALLRELPRDRWAWISHTRLARPRDRWPLPPTAAFTFVLIDESHAFRNPATQRYRALASLTRSSRVLLMTATPINNSLMDLYFQLRLGLADGALASAGIPDLASAFHEATRTGETTPALQRALREVVIRSREHPTRTEDTAQGQGLRFPHRETPIAVRYPADPRFRPWLRDILGLSFAAFTPDRPGQSPRALLHLLLVKRLQSSTAALRATATGLLRWHELFLEALEAGRLLRPAWARSRFVDDRALQLSLTPLLGEPLPSRLDIPRVRERVARDHNTLARIVAALRTGPPDPKLEHLHGLLDGPLAGHRVLLFTEFRETAAALWSDLRPRGRIGRIDGAGAWLGADRATRMAVVRRFAPHANDAPPPPPHQAVDLLIATDVLSEGINLQDADVVVSYDLPWNPVRLIQRVGRIHRMGSPHDRILCYNFMPDHEMDEIVRVVARLAAKLAQIRTGMGEADAVLDAQAGPADPAFLGRLSRGDPSLLDERDTREAETDLRDALLARPLTATAHTSATLSGSAAIPIAPIPSNRTDPAGTLIVAVEEAGRVRLFRRPPATRALGELEGEDAADLLRRAAGIDDTVHCPPIHAGAVRRLKGLLRDVDARLLGTDRRLSARSSAGVLVRALRRRMVAERDQRLLARADALARRLASGLTAGETACVNAALARAINCRPSDLLSAVERCLGPMSGRQTPGHRILGAFVVMDPHPRPAGPPPPPASQQPA